VVGPIGDDLQQLFDAPTPDRRNYPKLGKIGADRVDDSRLLADKEMACSMQHQAALLLDCLGRQKAHIGSPDRLANHLRVGTVLLLPLDIVLHFGGSHQPNRSSACNSRDQWCDEAHASIPTRHGGSFSKKDSTKRRFSWRRITTCPAASIP